MSKTKIVLIGEIDICLVFPDFNEHLTIHHLKVIPL